MFNIQFHKADGNQTFQGSGSIWEATNIKMIRPFDPVVTWIYVENKKQNIMSTFLRPMTTTLTIHKVTLPFGYVKLSTNLQNLVILRSQTLHKKEVFR